MSGLYLRGKGQVITVLISRGGYNTHHKIKIPMIPIMSAKLVYRWNDFMNSFVFADYDQAIRTDQLHRALFRCKTWAELKSSVHPDEYTFIIYMFYEFNDNETEPEPEGEINWEFIDEESYYGGIYPAFLIYLMADVIPAEILVQFGSDERITDYGSYREIKPEKLVPMISALTARGYEVTPAGDLIFDAYFTE